MILGCRSGHNEKCRGAKAILDEVIEDRKIFSSTTKYLKPRNTIINCTPYHNPSNQAEDLKYGVDRANNNNVDLFFSIHLNKAYEEVQNYAMGCEVWVYDKNSTVAIEKAKRILKNLEDLGFKNRGIKYMKTEKKELYELNETEMDAIIVECFFLESKVDCDLYNKLGYDKVGQAIANGIDSKIKLETDNREEYQGETIVLVDSPDSTDMNAAKYFNIYLGYGILTPEQYMQRANPKDKLIGLGGAVCNRTKCNYSIIGKDGVDTCQKSMEVIQSLR